jgi:hypothetical protein
VPYALQHKVSPKTAGMVLAYSVIPGLSHGLQLDGEPNAHYVAINGPRSSGKSKAIKMAQWYLSQAQKIRQEKMIDYLNDPCVSAPARVHYGICQGLCSFALFLE